MSGGAAAAMTSKLLPMGAGGARCRVSRCGSMVKGEGHRAKVLGGWCERLSGGLRSLGDGVRGCLEG